MLARKVCVTFGDACDQSVVCDFEYGGYAFRNTSCWPGRYCVTFGDACDQSVVCDFEYGGYAFRNTSCWPGRYV